MVGILVGTECAADIEGEEPNGPIDGPEIPLEQIRADLDEDDRMPFLDD